MNSIQIVIPGTDLEQMSITLSELEVTAIYNSNKAMVKEIEELKKKLKDSESNLSYAQKGRETADSELMQANMLMTALGVQEKTQEEEKYYQKPLPVATRIALYIAASK